MKLYILNVLAADGRIAYRWSPASGIRSATDTARHAADVTGKPVSVTDHATGRVVYTAPRPASA